MARLAVESRFKGTINAMSRWMPDPVERMNIVLSATAVAASFALAPPRFAVSVAAGALLETINFRGLRRASRRLFARELPGARAWMVQAALRFSLLAAAMYFTLDVGANPIGLVLGLSLIVPATIWVAWQTEPPPIALEDFDVPPPDDPSWDEWNPWLARERELDPDDVVVRGREVVS